MTSLISHLQNEIQNMKSDLSSPFRKRAIQKVISQLRLQKKIDAQTIQKMELTKHMKDKLIRLLKEPLRVQVDPRSKLMEVLGIGQMLATKLVNAGVKSRADLMKPKFFAMLPIEAQIMIKYNPCRRIPNEVIRRLEALLLAPHFDVTLTGSYRRGKPFIRDIDLMVAEPLSKYKKYIAFLLKKFKAQIYSNGDDRTSCVILFENFVLKVDVFRAQHKYAMLLYSTGSKEFNIRMRRRAKKMGMLLNQDGLWYRGKRIPIKSEKEFFSKLGWDYIEPKHRN